MRFTKNILITSIAVFIMALFLVTIFSEPTFAAKCNSGVECINQAQKDPNASQLFKLLNGAVTFLTVGVGVVITAMIVVGGIQYTTANGDPNKVAAAKSIVFNALFALVAFIFLWAFLQWLVPGGVFS